MDLSHVAPKHRDLVAAYATLRAVIYKAQRGAVGRDAPEIMRAALRGIDAQIPAAAAALPPARYDAARALEVLEEYVTRTLAEVEPRQHDAARQAVRMLEREVPGRRPARA